MIPSSNLTRADQTAVSEAPGAVGPLSTETLFWRARFLRESADLHHLPFLFWLVEVSRPQLVVEFGVGTGVSHFATCQSLDKLMPQARCEGVGVWEDGDVPTDLDEYNAQHYAEFSSLRSGDPKADIGRYDDKSIDILHINQPADSTLLSCLRYDWRHKMSSQGVVVLHGLTTNFGSDEAREFIRNLERSLPTIRLENGDGLIAVLYGSRRSPQLQKVAESSSGKHGFSRLHSALTRLGFLHHYEWRFVDQSEKIAQLRYQHQSLEATEREEREQRQALNQRLQELTSAYDERNQVLTVLQSKAFDHQSELFSAKQSLLDLQVRHEANLREQEGRERKIEQLQEALSITQEETDQYRREFEAQESRLMDRIDELEQQLSNPRAPMDSESRDSRTLSSLEQQLSAQRSSADNQRRELEAAIEENKKRVEELLEEKRGTADQIASLSSSVGALETKNRLVVSENEALKEKLTSANEKVKLLESRLETRAADFNALLNAIEAQEIDATLQTGELKTTIAERDEQIAQLRDQIDQLEATKDEILSSTSWRMTAPARSVINRIRGRTE